MYKPFLFIIFLLVGPPVLEGQQTIFNVPSPDVLDKAHVYGEFDFTARHSDGTVTFTPRVVFGIGHRVEVGLNFNGLSHPASGEFVFSPSIKWRFYDGGSNGWTAFVGDDIFLPAHNRQYNVGDYAYIELGKKFRGTRIAAGPFLFSRNVVASGKKVGVQATFEQAITKRLTLAADWYSGDHSNGYFNPGVVYQLNSKFSFYATYQLGNSRLTQGNHQALLEIGYNFH